MTTKNNFYKVRGLIIGDDIEILTLSTDPSIVGYDAKIGSLVVYQGKLYIKYGSMATNWERVGNAKVNSVFGRIGDVVAQSGDYDTSMVSENGNLYFTNTRADARITAQKGVANGLATLDANSKIPTSQLPAITITDTYTVNNQSEMLALVAQRGDVAIRLDLNKSFILINESPSLIGSWQELLSPSDAVSSVNGQVGTVVLTTTNISEGTNLYFTTSRAINSLLIGFNSTSGGIVNSSDSILVALQKHEYRLNNLISSPLISGDEGNGIGFWLNGDDRSKKLSIGKYGFDFIDTDDILYEYGVYSNYTIGLGKNTRVHGHQYSLALGLNIALGINPVDNTVNESGGTASIVTGYNNKINSTVFSYISGVNLQTGSQVGFSSLHGLNHTNEFGINFSHIISQASSVNSTIATELNTSNSTLRSGLSYTRAIVTGSDILATLQFTNFIGNNITSTDSGSTFNYSDIISRDTNIGSTNYTRLSGIDNVIETGNFSEILSQSSALNNINFSKVIINGGSIDNSQFSTITNLGTTITSINNSHVNLNLCQPINSISFSNIFASNSTITESYNSFISGSALNISLATYALILGGGSTVNGASNLINVGTNTNNVGSYQFVLGNNNTVQDSFATAIGDGNKSANYSFAYGAGNRAAVNDSGNTVSYATIAMGVSNRAYGTTSGAFGNSNEVYSTSSFAFGNANIIDRCSFSHAIGDTNKVYGTHSIALGGTNNIIQDGAYCSLIGGFYNKSWTNFSINLGFQNELGQNIRTGLSGYGTTGGFNHIGLGTGILTSNPRQIVVGYHNENLPNTTFELGNGSTPDDELTFTRRNAISVYTDNTVELYKFRLKNGQEGANKVLTSDANGNATWTTLSSSGGGTEGYVISRHIATATALTYYVGISGAYDGTNAVWFPIQAKNSHTNVQLTLMYHSYNQSSCTVIVEYSDNGSTWLQLGSPEVVARIDVTTSTRNPVIFNRAATGTTSNRLYRLRVTVNNNSGGDIVAGQIHFS